MYLKSVLIHCLLCSAAIKLQDMVCTLENVIWGNLNQSSWWAVVRHFGYKINFLVSLLRAELFCMDTAHRASLLASQDTDGQVPSTFSLPASSPQTLPQEIWELGECPLPFAEINSVAKYFSSLVNISCLLKRMCGHYLVDTSINIYLLNQAH